MMIKIFNSYFNAMHIEAITLNGDVVEVWMHNRECSIDVEFENASQAEHAHACAGKDLQEALENIRPL